MAIRILPVDLGAKTIQIPVARIEGKNSGRTLLITAGNDGDEYAGIAAAYRLIEEFSTKTFAGTLIIVPIVNIPGFESEVSYNPLDKKFPKYIFPGSKNGSPSERLRFWFSEQTNGCDMWVDLHDGALTESLLPFICALKSGVSAVDARTEQIITQAPMRHALYIERQPWNMIKPLARFSCGYVCVESGSFGAFDQQAIARHVSCAKSVMDVLGMINEKAQKTQKTVYQGLAEYAIGKNGLWTPMVLGFRLVKKGEVLGVVRSLEGTIIERCTARQGGQLLWIKEGLRAAKGDIVAGIGY